MLLVPDYYLKPFNEVEVNGENIGDENTPSTDYTTPDPVNAAGADNPPQGEPAGDPPPDDTDEGETTDYTAGDEGGDVPPEGAPDEGGDPEGDTTDYTADGGGGDPGAEGEPPPDDGGGGAPAGGDGQVTADDARGMEEELFKDLTPDQIDLKHQELKSNFVQLYESTNNIIERINDIPSNEDYLATISFVSESLMNLRTMVADYLNNVYSTKSYMENAINYNRFLAVLNSINDILDEVANDISPEDPK